MAFRVEFTARANEDLDAILAWLQVEQAGDTGLRWFSGLQDALFSLEHFPRRCRLLSASRGGAPEIRELFHGEKPHVYRVLFAVGEDTVTILHIRHGRRLPLELW